MSKNCLQLNAHQPKQTSQEETRNKPLEATQKTFIIETKKELGTDCKVNGKDLGRNYRRTGKNRRNNLWEDVGKNCAENVM